MTKDDKKHIKPRGKKALMIKALNTALGIVSNACSQVGISRETHYRWLREDENYNYFVNEAKYELKDFGEHLLLKLMKDGNSSATIFFNKTKNKDRGYFERKEVDINDQRKRILIEKADDDNNKVETEQETGTGAGSSSE